MIALSASSEDLLLPTLSRTTVLDRVKHRNCKSSIFSRCTILSDWLIEDDTAVVVVVVVLSADETFFIRLVNR